MVGWAQAGESIGGEISGENKPFAALIESLSGCSSFTSRKVFVYNMAFVRVIFLPTV